MSEIDAPDEKVQNFHPIRKTLEDAGKTYHGNRKYKVVNPLKVEKRKAAGWKSLMNTTGPRNEQLVIMEKK